MTTNILQYLERTADRLPDKAAICDEDQTLTFRQLRDGARAIGSRLHRMGLYRQPVAVYMGRQPLTVAAYLGILYAGCWYVPLDVTLPPERLRHILSTVQPAVCICDDCHLPAEPMPLLPIQRLLRGPIDDDALAQIRARHTDTDPMYVVFTSGSTGVPKGVTGSHRAVIDYAEGLCRVLDFDEDTVFGCQAPLHLDACLKELMGTLKFGAATWLIPRPLFSQPMKLVAYLNDHAVNTLCWVPSALTMISATGTLRRTKPKHLRLVAFAGEVFPPPQLDRWRQALPDTRFVNLYGPTEATGVCCWYEVTGPLGDTAPLPIGRPLPNTDILLLDEDDRPAAPGQPGEICIRGSRLTLGYYGDRARTAMSFVQNPLNPSYPERIYRTGDLGKLDDRGLLLFLGRKDQQIKHMGHRIEIGDIEAAACDHPQVTAACCVYDPDRKRLHLYYTGELAPAVLGKYLARRLPRYMHPHSLHRLPQLPRTGGGKPDRNQLLQRSMNHEPTDPISEASAP